jgi:transcriptional regulator with XRE-family HTH domain
MNQGAVKLRQYIEAERISARAFARIIKATQPTVHRYLHGRVPSVEIMARITKATEGAVTPNDWLTPSRASAKKKTRETEAA